jgi:hypothetical protein
MEGSEHPLTINDNNQEDVLFSRPRSASVQTRRSWPLLPTLQVINSIGSNSNEHNFSVRRPTIDEIIETRTADSSESESSTSSGFGMEEKQDVFDNIPNDTNRRKSTVGATRKDSAGTLVEAALDQAEARDRHVRFPDHIAEAGSLVQRMISTRYPSSSNEHHHHNNTIDEAGEHTHNEDIHSLEMQSPIANNLNNGGGSVLGSLMKLESQRRPATVKRQKTIKRKKVTLSFLYRNY